MQTDFKIKYDGQILYKNGNIKILDYGCTEIILDEDSKKDIESVILPNSVTCIQENAFANCTQINSIFFIFTHSQIH